MAAGAGRAGMGGGMEAVYGGYGGGEEYYDDGSYGSYGGMAMGGGGVGGGASAGMSMVPMMLPNGQVRPAPWPRTPAFAGRLLPRRSSVNGHTSVAMALARMPCSSQTAPIGLRLLLRRPDRQQPVADS